MAADNQSVLSTEEITAILREVRDRARARHPQSSHGGPPDPSLPDLLPLVHARDAAEGKVAAIGSVNPRRGGPVNAAIQLVKKTVARLLDWHVRDQVEFNRKMVSCIDANIEALNDANRTFVELAGRIRELHRLSDEADQLKDIRTHWSEWRLEWERKLSLNEMQFLRGLADMQAAFQHRATLMESNFRDVAKSQHQAFETVLDKKVIEVQQRLWADLERIRLEYERLIHTELRVVRQRAIAAAPAAVASSPPADRTPQPLQFDYARFAERFRGSEQYVREGQRFYLPYFRHCRNVLDIGCGRGEFLELMREAGVPAKGIEQSAESVGLCRAKGLAAEEADLFKYLADQAEGTFDGIFCSQVVEHIEPGRLPALILLASSRLERGGVLAIETPNPECLAIFATHFYLDPTHHRPIPHPLLAFYLEEYGMGTIEVHKLSPAIESMPALATLPPEFREAFFGGLDYAIIARKLA